MKSPLKGHPRSVKKAERRQVRQSILRALRQWREDQAADARELDDFFDDGDCGYYDNSGWLGFQSTPLEIRGLLEMPCGGQKPPTKTVAGEIIGMTPDEELRFLSDLWDELPPPEDQALISEDVARTQIP